MKTHAPRGMTMIELMVGIAIVALLLSLAAPGFATWIQNTHIRTAAEAIQNGLQLARAEAVRRNTQVRFQLTTTTDNSCALSTAGTNWVISLSDPTGACGNAIPDPSNLSPPAPGLIQVRAGAEGSKNAQVSAEYASIVFNGLGRVTPPIADADNMAEFEIKNSKGGACASSGGPMRCLNVMVSNGGEIRMCDPMFPSTDPQGCPP